MGSLRERLEMIDDLPALPTALGKLMSMLTDDNVSSQDVESVIIIDRAIGMAVLRAANSARFGGNMNVGSLKDAITRLGSKNLLHVALAQQATEFFRGAGKGYGLSEAEAWEGALAGAFAAERLAQNSGRCEPGMAFTAALLRDCGKLAMDLLVGIENLGGTLRDLEGSKSTPEAEVDAFGFDHAEVGSTLAEMWGLPDPLVEAIRHHHEPRLDEESALIDAVYCADLVAIQLGYGVGWDGLNYTIDQGALERMKLDEVAISILMADVESQMSQFDLSEESEEATS